MTNGATAAIMATPTLMLAGKAGLRTKADAATCFDDLTVSEVKSGGQ